MKHIISLFLFSSITTLFGQGIPNGDILNESSQSNTVSTKGSESTAGRTLNRNVVPIMNTFIIDSMVVLAQTFINNENFIDVIYRKTPNLFYQKYSINGESEFDSLFEIQSEYVIEYFDSEIKEDSVFIIFDSEFAANWSHTLERVMINPFDGITFQYFMDWDSESYFPNIEIIRDTSILGVWKNHGHEFGLEDEIAAQQFDLDYQPIGDPYILLSYEIDPEFDLESGIDMVYNQETDLLLVMWIDNRMNDGTLDLFGHLFDGNGESLGSSFSLNEPHQSSNVNYYGLSKNLITYGESFLLPYLVENTDISKWDLYLTKISFEGGAILNESIFVSHLDSTNFSHVFDLYVNDIGYGLIMWSSVDYEFPILYSSSINGILIEPELEFQQEILNFVLDDSIPSFKYIQSISMNNNFVTFTYTENFINENTALKTGVIVMDSLFTNMDVETSTVPEVLSLSAYPNPFNPTTTLKFDIPFDESIQNVSLAIYDLMGRQVVSLINGSILPGTYSIQWDAGEFSSGMYFARMIFGSTVKTQKILLLK